MTLINREETYGSIPLMSESENESESEYQIKRHSQMGCIYCITITCILFSYLLAISFGYFLADYMCIHSKEMTTHG